MRRIVLSALACALLLSAVQLFAQGNTAVEKALETKEQDGWQAWKDHNTKSIEDMIPESVINVADGTITRSKQAVLKSMVSTACQVNGFSLSGYSFMWLDKDTVLMTYTATQDATCSGQKQPAKVFASSLWQKKGGKWMSPFHQETAM